MAKKFIQQKSANLRLFWKLLLLHERL